MKEAMRGKKLPDYIHNCRAFDLKECRSHLFSRLELGGWSLALASDTGEENQEKTHQTASIN
jgi:hypothetical protein